MYVPGNTPVAFSSLTLEWAMRVSKKKGKDEACLCMMKKTITNSEEKRGGGTHL